MTSLSKSLHLYYFSTAQTPPFSILKPLALMSSTYKQTSMKAILDPNLRRALNRSNKKRVSRSRSRSSRMSSRMTMKRNKKNKNNFASNPRK